MKTAEEWLALTQAEQGISHCTTHAWIQSIQMDALKEGMTRAADVVEFFPAKSEFEFERDGLIIDAIIKVRDNTKSL